MKPQILVFGYGNPARGDDALGPLLLEQLEARRASDWLQAIELECLTDFQLQIEHALDMPGRDQVIFVDAHTRCPPPCTLEPLQPCADHSYTSHALTPAALLQVFRDIHPARELPPCFLLSIRGYRFELGDPLSPQAEAHLSAALQQLEQHIRQQVVQADPPADPYCLSV